MSSKMCELLYKNIFRAFQIVSESKKNPSCRWTGLVESSYIIIVQNVFEFWARSPNYFYLKVLLVKSTFALK